MHLLSGDAFANAAALVAKDNSMKAQKLGTQITAITTSVAVVVVWVVIVTIALVVIGLVSFRRWRRDSFSADQGSAASLSVGSGEDLGDLSSDFGSLGEPTPVSQRRSVTRGAQNAGFVADDIEDSLSAEDDTEAGDLGSTQRPNSRVADIANVHLESPPRTEEAIS